MDFENLKMMQKEAISLLDNSYEMNRLSHAYIFEGDAGKMKFEAALYLASKLLCKADQRPCFSCNDCQRIVHQTHPNVIVIEPKKATIVKDDILQLQVEFSKTAVEVGPKIYIIKKAETMNAYAQNTLLKFLEEPHPDIYGILLATETTKLLPTIVSRSQNIHFKRPKDDHLEKELLEAGYPPETSRLAARLESTFHEAKMLLDNIVIEELMDAVRAVYQSIVDDGSPLLVFQKDVAALLDDKEQATRLLEIFIYYQKDLIYGRINNRQQLTFPSDVDLIEACANRFELDDLIAILERMLMIKVRQASYINLRLAFDNLMLDVERRQSHG